MTERQFLPHDLGTDYPDGTCINSFGDIMVLDEDGNNYKIIGKTHKLTK